MQTMLTTLTSLYLEFKIENFTTQHRICNWMEIHKTSCGKFVRFLLLLALIS